MRFFPEKLLQLYRPMKKMIKKISSIMLMLGMTLSCFSAKPVFAADTAAPEMRVGYSPQKFDQMSPHSSPSLSASEALRPFRFNTLDASIWFCVRQKITKGTKVFKLEDRVDPCLKVTGISIQPGDRSAEYRNHFDITQPKTNTGTRLTITATEKAAALYATKDVVLDFYIICSFDKTYSRTDTRSVSARSMEAPSASGEDWIVGNNAIVTMGTTKKYSNYSYICGASSLWSDKTEDAAFLYYEGGERLFGVVNNVSSGNATFPSVNLGVAGGNCVGWLSEDELSDSEEFTSPKLVAGDKIPKSGNYYMAIYTKADDDKRYETIKKGKKLHSPREGTAVYFVGDSRTEYMGNVLENYQKWFTLPEPVLAPNKINIIAKAGEGLDWFKSQGLSQLKDAMAVNKGKKHVVIINLGVNNAAGVSAGNTYDITDEYIKYMKDSVYTPLKALYQEKVTFYYMSVNPLCSQALKDELGPTFSTTEQNVVNFNNKIREGLCPDDNSCFIYLDSYNELFLGEGWLPRLREPEETEFDGIHYYKVTLIRIYNYCMETIFPELKGKE